MALFIERRFGPRSRTTTIPHLSAKILGGLLVFSLWGPLEMGASASPARSATDPRPNIVLIVGDDMRASDLSWMPEVRRLLARPGVRVRGMLSNHPTCCPARAELLTGQYAQNSGVHGNNGQFGGYDSLTQPGNSIGTWLQDAGYSTGFIGKFLNEWERQPQIEPGWNRFDPIVKNIYEPYGLTMFNNGVPRSYPDVYSTRVIGGRAIGFVERHAPADSPFFLWVNHVPPHARDVDGSWRPPQPQPRYADLYRGVSSPAIRDPAFDEADVSDKPAWVRALPRYSENRSNTWHLARIRSLRSVDDEVRRLVEALRRAGELDNTYVVFTSDNGHLLGEHRFNAKNVPYEPAIRVPFIVRGPDLPAGVVRRQMFELIDVVPTILGLAGASADRVLDGRSMFTALRDGAPGKSFSLIQGGTTDAPWWWRGVRSERYKYVRYASGFEELYDLRTDPGELRNLAPRPAYAHLLTRYSAKLDALGACSGDACLAQTS